VTTESDGGSEEAGDGSSDSVARSGFCKTAPFRSGYTFCADFDDTPNPHGQWTAAPSPANASLAPDRGESVSPPSSALLTVEFPTSGQARANIGFVPNGRPSRLWCRFDWRVVERPSTVGDDLDLFALVFPPTDSGSPEYVHGVIERAGGIGLFRYGGYDRLGDSGSEWARIELDYNFELKTVRATFNDGGSRDLPFDAPAASVPRVVVGAIDITNGPWKARFDNAYCEVDR
jgi:hypothetical protein